MNVGKLKRVAIKEFTRSPAKSGFLLVMLPVALYFCVPLLLGAAKKSSLASSTTGMDGPMKADFVLPAAMELTTTPCREQQGWAEVARGLAEDLLTKPAELPSNTRNPFAAIVQETPDESLAMVEVDEQVVGSDRDAESDAAVEQEQAVVTANPIRELGLQLNATMIGRRARLATINGKTYEEGETIPVIIEAGVEPDDLMTIELRLEQVDRRFVVLQLDGQQHRLQLRNEIPKDAIVVKPRPE